MSKPAIMDDEDALKADIEKLRNDKDLLAFELLKAKRRLDKAEKILASLGYKRCYSLTCGCGSYH